MACAKFSSRRDKYNLLGDAVYDEDVAGLEETVVHTLKEQGLTLSTAESCTGGLIAQRITSVSGSSEVFGYGFVTYWEQAKAKLIGVDPDVIAKYNVVSAPVAAQMALGAAAGQNTSSLCLICQFRSPLRVIRSRTPCPEHPTPRVHAAGTRPEALSLRGSCPAPDGAPVPAPPEPHGHGREHGPGGRRRAF